VNLEINCEVMLEMLDYRWVEAKLYTNAEDNEDGAAGEFLCSVTPTTIVGAFGTGVDMVIDGGFFRSDGLHMNGSMIINTPEVQTNAGPLAFINFIVPSRMEMTNSANDKLRKYCSAHLEEPVNVTFQGFTMEVREMDMECMFAELKTDGVDRSHITEDIPLRLTLSGSTLLSESIALGQNTTDSVILERYEYVFQQNEGDQYYDDFLKLLAPKVLYEDCRSVLQADFDGCVEVSGVLVPKLTDSGKAEAVRLSAVSGGSGGGGAYGGSGGSGGSGGGNGGSGADGEYVFLSSAASLPSPGDYASYNEGLIEFNADNLGLNFLGQMQDLKVDTITRFGFDMTMERCYFAVGLIPDASLPEKDRPINFGAGNVKDFTGLVAYNMEVKRDGQKHYEFPDGGAKSKENMEKFIMEELSVNRGSGSSFAAAIKGTLMISGFAEVRNLYFGFDSGPSVIASGELYAPLSVKSMIERAPEKRIGAVSIMYRHPERYFSFSITLDEIDVVVAKVSGSLGFEFSPTMFGVYIGYPETLAGEISIFRVGVGVGFKIDKADGMLIMAKMELGFQKSVRVAIVYLEGYLYAGADGSIHFSTSGAPDGFSLTLYLKGGIKGGIYVGKPFNIINLYLDARGTLARGPSDPKWNLSASATVGYSLNLFLFKVSGSVNASFDTDVG
jgi:hypothetical protein